MLWVFKLTLRLSAHRSPDSLVQTESPGKFSTWQQHCAGEPVNEGITKPQEQLSQKNWCLKQPNWGQKPEPKWHTHSNTHSESASIGCDGKVSSYRSPKQTQTREREVMIKKLCFLHSLCHDGRCQMWHAVVGYGCLYSTLKRIAHIHTAQFIYTHTHTPHTLSQLSLSEQQQQHTQHKQTVQVRVLECRPVARKKWEKGRIRRCCHLALPWICQWVGFLHWSWREVRWEDGDSNKKGEESGETGPL